MGQTLIFLQSLTLYLFCSYVIITCSSKSYYRAAVVEYKPEGSPWTLPPLELLQVNAVHYKKFIEEASDSGADIVIFPEYGLTTLGIPRNREDARPFLSFIPEVGQNPCNETNSNFEIIKFLSCAAKESQIYTVINIGEKALCTGSDDPCHPDGFRQFNTNVAFDQNGTIIAKYHKKNLYFEDQFEPPSESALLSTFTTDFGVNFGLFTCYDIIFYQPAILLVEQCLKNFILTTAWVDELPFLTAIQSQATWAMSAGVNLLASGYHQPLGGQLGSGIYSGEFGAINYTFDPNSGSNLVIGDVPIEPESPTHPRETCSDSSKESKRDGTAMPFQKHSYLHEKLDNYTTKILDLNISRDSLCTENGFCCKFEYNLANDVNAFPYSEQSYRMTVFDGFRTVAQETASFHWQTCALIRCQNRTLGSCTARANPEENHLPNFKLLRIRAAPFKLNEHIRPSLNTLDINLQNVAFDLFHVSSPGSHNSEAMIESKFISTYAMQTIAIINKVYYPES